MTSEVTATSPGGPGGLRRAAEEYLATRRALGFVLSTQGWLLMDFVAHCERHAIATVTKDAAVAWAICTAGSQDPLWWAQRLMVVRIFARHLRALDPATQLPPMDSAEAQRPCSERLCAGHRERTGSTGRGVNRGMHPHGAAPPEEASCVGAPFAM